MESPRTASMKSSGEPRAMTMGRATGRTPNATTAPISPPTMEARNAAARAREASPRRAMG